MKILFLLAISILVFEGCGKKSDPAYQGKMIKEKLIV
tara:strand:- start:20 stop:130 length:111 start_codon:yes stop_codon:yes gene_type:complete